MFSSIIVTLLVAFLGLLSVNAACENSLSFGFEDYSGSMLFSLSTAYPEDQAVKVFTPVTFSQAVTIDSAIAFGTYSGPGEFTAVTMEVWTLVPEQADPIGFQHERTFLKSYSGEWRNDGVLRFENLDAFTFQPGDYSITMYATASAKTRVFNWQINNANGRHFVYNPALVNDDTSINRSGYHAGEMSYSLTACPVAAV